jgi:Protein of unknown function (DUF1460).
MKKLILFFALLCFTQLSFSQVYTEKDVEICKNKIQLSVSKELAKKPINEVIIEIGKSFLGTEYVASTLEKVDTESLIVNLTGLDCTTYLENMLVFARIIKKDKTSFDDYLKELQYVRYRDGKIQDYTSRLHYFSDWIYENVKKGIVKNVTKEIGGEPIKFNTYFMSQNPDKYRMLKANPKFIPVIKAKEEEINKRKNYYIPKDKVAKYEDKIHTGDLIAITTNIKGMDVGHVGVAIKQPDGRIYFMHAPLSGSKVQISENPLPEYLAKVAKHTGIIVLRAVEPK